jgi:hypothetical protein
MDYTVVDISLIVALPFTEYDLQKNGPTKLQRTVPSRYEVFLSGANLLQVLVLERHVNKLLEYDDCHP